MDTEDVFDEASDAYEKRFGDSEYVCFGADYICMDGWFTVENIEWIAAKIKEIRGMRAKKERE